MRAIALICAIVLAGACLGLQGCTSLGFGWSDLQTSDADKWEDKEDGRDAWGYVGQSARADQRKEKDPDRWWHNYVISPQHRAIERNLGVE